MAGKIKVTLVKSMIGSPRKIREHLKGLGLKKINQVKELEDTPAVRGLIFHVKHLVKTDPPEAVNKH